MKGNIRRLKIGFLSMFFLLLASGCGKKFAMSDEEKIYNKPAMFWYQKIADSIANAQIDKADKYYLSLKSEHSKSPLLETALLMLARAHMQKEEYLLATFYLDEYSKRFGENRSHEYIEFLKLKASFLGIKDVYKDQKLILDTIEKSHMYLIRYPDAKYRPLVETMLVRMMMAQYLLNENIASLYERIGKKKAAEIYRSKNEDSVLQSSDIRPPEQSIVGKIFD